MAPLIPRHVRLKGAPLTKPAPLGASGAVEAKSVPMLSLPAQYFFGIADGQVQDAPLAGMGTYAVAALAYICMSFRATKLVEAPVWIVDETDDGEEWLVGTHPLERLLEQPNPDLTAAEFWELVSLYLDAPGGGSVLLVKVRDRAGRVASLYPYSRPEFTVEPADGRLFGKFTVATLTGPRVYGPDDVIYLRETDPRSPWSVLSAGDAALGDLNLGENQRRAVQAAFRNTMSPGAAIETAEGLSDEQYLRLKAQIAESYAGVQNAGKTMLLEKGRLTQLKSSLRELDLGPLMAHVEATVCAAFKLHPILLGLHVSGEMNGGLADSLGPAQELFYDLCILPRWARIGEKLTQGLLREVEPANMRRFLRFDYTKVRALQDDVGEKVLTAAAATFWTTNEKRAFTGMAPVDDPAADMLQVGPVAPTEGGDEGDPEDEATDAEKRAAVPEAKAVSDRDIAWMLFDAVASTQEESLKLTTRELLQADRDHIAGLVRASEKAAPGAPERKETARPLTPEELEALEAAVSAYLAGEGAAAWRAKMRPALALVGRGAVERVAASVGVSFDVLQEGLLEYIDREAAWLIDGVSDTTKDAVRRALRDGIVAGESIPDLAKRITDAAGFSEQRATLIARTETVRVTNGAQTEQMAAYAKRSGRTVTRTWLTARDDRVRDEHRAMEGQVREIGKAFSNGEMFPSSPNCRCTTLIHLADEEAAT